MCRRPRLASTVTAFLALSFFAQGCVEEESGSHQAGPSLAPLTGKADGTDTAERDCNIVLRSIWRSPGPTGFEVDCSAGPCWFVWEGTLDVSSEALEIGAVPFVLYRAGLTSWWEVGARTVEGAAEGYQRFQFRLSENTLPAGMGGTAMTRAYLEVIPFLLLNGLRHFDHNRLPGDLDNYVLDLGNGFSIEDQPSACASVPMGVAHLEMPLGWINVQRGALVAGGSLVVDYDIGRLPECRGTHNGYPTWNVVAHARFSPGGEQVAVTVRAFDQVHGTPLPTGYSTPAHLGIPAGATGVELWFENFNGGEACQRWDSNLGQNYRYPVLAAPPAPVGWAGELGNGFNRECAHVSGINEPTTIGSWEMERACLYFDGEVWIPGITDANGPQEHVLAKAEFSIDGGELEQTWLHFVERVGNNYRYRWTLPREWLRRNEWSSISWALRFSTDGLEWYRVGLADGPEGGAPRTVINGM